jgi:CBS domain-containing protein
MTRMTKACAADLMQAEVMHLTSETPIREAIALFEEYNIRGAPVVDGSGNLIGMLSASDISRSDHVHGDRLSTEGGEYSLAEPSDGTGEETFEAQGYSPEVTGKETVGGWMRHGIISVRPDATLKHVCEVMAQESIHRVLVTDNGHLKGLISAFDVVKYFARTL